MPIQAAFQAADRSRQNEFGLDAELAAQLGLPLLGVVGIEEAD